MSMIEEYQQESLREWVSEWQEESSHRYAPHDLEAMFGKKVVITRPGTDERYTFIVVGYAKQVIHDGTNTAVVLSIITLDSRQIQLKKGVELTVVED